MESEISRVLMKQLLPVMEEQFRAGGTVLFSPSGISMLPLIRQGKDSVTLSPPPKRLKKYDIPLYRRSSGQFVLHRVVGASEGSYTMCGDNQYVREYGITHDSIIAVVSEIRRGGKSISVNDPAYLKYCRRRVRRQYIKGLYFKLRGRAARAVKSIMHKS